MAIKGMAQVRRNLNKQLVNVIPEKAVTAMHVSTVIVGGYATLMTPADSGILRNSQYRTVTQRGKKVVAAIGYTARYAAWVHSAKGKLKGQPRASGRGNYWDPDATPQFLSKAGDENVAEIDAAVLKAMRA